MEQFKRLANMLTVRQQWTILIAVIVSAACVYSVVRWQRESNFRPLYNSLAPEDAAVVVQKLKESGIPYRISNSTVSVPDEKVAELRLEMAGAGVPKNGRIGFEIFDKTNFGMTDFAEHINYRRALEGELERSVMALSEVEQARVHISFPQESVFLDARQPAKASVLVKIRAGASLPDTAVPAITHLVGSAVEGLTPEAVSVLDMRGNLLNRPARRSGAGEESSEAALEYRHKVEQDLNAKLDSTLEPLVGAGRFRTAVSAECDLTSGEQSEESFDPARSVMVTSQKSEDVSSPAHLSAGIPGTASNLPESTPRPAASRGGLSRKTENVNYQTSRTVKRTVLPQGAIKRLSISVLIDHEVHWEGTGATAKRILVPPAPERLKVIHDLVAAASGFNPERGDQLMVQSLPFESTLNLDPPPPLAPQAPVPTKTRSPIEQLKSDPKIMIGLAVVALTVLGGVFWLVRRMVKKPASAAVEFAPPGLASPPDVAQAAARLPQGPGRAEPDTWTVSSPAASKLPPLAPGRIEILTNRIRDTAQKDGDVCAGVLRGWLGEERI
jgi:flagellar M-ring protein FliF